jgi:hypothetical protein
MYAPCFVGVGGVSEQVGVDVLSEALPPGQHVKTLGVHVSEQDWGPAAAVEPDQDRPLVADSPAQVG